MSISRHQAVGAYRRWEPPTFGSEPKKDGETADRDAMPGGGSPATQPAAPDEGTPASPPAQRDAEPPIQLPTAADIEAMFEDARHDGHQAGYREGAEQAREEATRIAALADGLDEALVRLDGDVAEELLALAIEVARRMVRKTLAAHPEAIIETVRAALSQLPQAHARIHLHPDDMALVRAYLDALLEHGRHALVEDDAVSRGGCRVLTAGGEIDATLETRWRRILEGLDRKDTDWQQPA